MNIPSASVVIPAHGHAGMTENCVRHVIDTTRHMQGVEIVVVDDCSPEPLVLPTDLLPHARVVRTPRNLMFAGACNVGAAATRGDVIVFLNNDTETQSGWLEAMLEPLGGDTGIAITGSRLLYRDGTVQHAGVAFSQRDGIPRHVYRGFPSDHPAVTRDRDFMAVTGACLAIRRPAFDAVGGFDEGFVNAYEDIDLCLKVRAAGHRIRYCAASIVYHHESVSRRGEIEDLRPEDDGNLLRFADRWLAETPRDELNVYGDDGLLWVNSGEIYPLELRCAAELAVTGDITDPSALVGLLNIRSRQVFDLEKDVGRLLALLLDNGIDPR